MWKTRDSCHKIFNPLPQNIINYVNIEHFSRLVMGHPDRTLVNYVINGLKVGFDIGFKGDIIITQPKNLLSANQHKIEITKAIITEVQRHHTSGPFQSPPFENLHCSPIGAVIKNGKCRLVMDLSQPKGMSINEFINKDDYSVQYTHFDVATDLVRQQGVGTYMSKVDIKHAFRLLPVRPDDWPLLGYCWEGQYFVDTRLPFGLRSSPAIFNQFANLVCWVIKFFYALSKLVHYADDFFLVSKQVEDTARNELILLQQAFSYLDIPLGKDKILGPSTSMTYLGIEINSVDLTISLPQEKYNDILLELKYWLKRKNCTKQQLLSLIGKLSFVCKVVRPGRIFLRRLINLSTSVEKLHHHINLNLQTLADIKWWHTFLPTWNKTSIIPDHYETLSSDIHLFTDASNIGLGAVYGKAWLQSRWSERFSLLSIDFKELFAIVAAASTWGSQWEGKRIVFVTDNLPITQIWDTGTTKSKEVMNLVRELFLIAAKKGFSVSMRHIPGIFNSIADALSRFQEHRFRSLLPDADVLPTDIPPTVWNL